MKIFLPFNRIAYCVVIILTITSCSNQLLQVMEISAANKDVRVLPGYNQTHVYQNDSIAVLYTFWAAKGTITFSVYNKLDIPIYLDWKKCAVVLDGGEKISYHNPSVRTDISYVSSYTWNGALPAIFGGSIVRQETVSEERISFIPPKSYHYRSDFRITNRYFDLTKTPFTEIPSVPNPDKTIQVKTVKLDKSNSPVKFRNFITWSTNESFSGDEHYIDNEFYISKITEVKESDFFDKKTNDSYFERNDRLYVFKPRIR